MRAHCNARRTRRPLTCWMRGLPTQMNLTIWKAVSRGTICCGIWTLTARRHVNSSPIFPMNDEPPRHGATIPHPAYAQSAVREIWSARFPPCCCLPRSCCLSPCASTSRPAARSSIASSAPACTGAPSRCIASAWAQLNTGPAADPRAHYDLDGVCVDNLSLWFDLRIIMLALRPARPAARVPAAYAPASVRQVAGE